MKEKTKIRQLHRLPEGSILTKESGYKEYTDSFVVTLKRTDVEPWEAIAAFFQSSPRWIDQLFILRNKLVKMIGLKSDMADITKINPPYTVGQRFGFFHLYHISDNEAVLGEDDKHLDFRLSFYLQQKDKSELAVSTVVKLNNRIGRVYFFVVKRIHRLIVPVMVKRMAENIDEKLLPIYKSN